MTASTPKGDLLPEGLGQGLPARPQACNIALHIRQIFPGSSLSMPAASARYDWMQHRLGPRTPFVLAGKGRCPAAAGFKMMSHMYHFSSCPMRHYCYDSNQQMYFYDRKWELNSVLATSMADGTQQNQSSISVTLCSPPPPPFPLKHEPLLVAIISVSLEHVSVTHMHISMSMTLGYYNAIRPISALVGISEAVPTRQVSRGPFPPCIDNVVVDRQAWHFHLHGLTCNTTESEVLT